MKHLFRAGILLLAVFILVLIVPKVIRVPDSLAEYGFHPQNFRANEEEWASLPIQYGQSAVCLNCHRDKYVMWEQSDHRSVACENCHGAAKAHSETGARLVVDTSRELCGTCHARLSARPASFPQVDMAEMGEQAACVTCHNPHDPRAGMPPKVPHSLEERTDCQSCHNPHEPIKVAPPRVPHTLEGRTNCLSCHGSEQFKKKTAPPSVPHTLDGRANCLLCHNAGSIKPFPKDHTGRTSETCLSCHRSK